MSNDSCSCVCVIKQGKETKKFRVGKIVSQRKRNKVDIMTTLNFSTSLLASITHLLICCSFLCLLQNAEILHTTNNGSILVIMICQLRMSLHGHGHGSLPTTSKRHYYYSHNLFDKKICSKNIKSSVTMKRLFASFSGQKRDLYEVLGLSRTATQEEIKRAFYTLSKKYHPDVVGSNAASAKKFMEVKEAYDTLKDDQKRREYDRLTGARAQFQYQQQQYPPNAQRQQQQNVHSDYNFHWQEKVRQAQTRGRHRRGAPFAEDYDFYRIWKAMEEDPEFQRAKKKIR